MSQIPAASVAAPAAAFARLAETEGFGAAAAEARPERAGLRA